MDSSHSLLTIWFGSDDLHSAIDDAHIGAWFRSDAAFDQDLRLSFEDDVRAAKAGLRDDRAATSAGALALLLLLDQLPRNIYRKDARQFESDAHARHIADLALQRGLDQGVSPLRRAFFYLPFEHAEDLANQDRSVALFTPLAAELGDLGKSYLAFAEKHRDVIRRFGRFPHRNALLGRASTPDEAQFLEGGRGF